MKTVTSKVKINIFENKKFSIYYVLGKKIPKMMILAFEATNSAMSAVQLHFPPRILVLYVQYASPFTDIDIYKKSHCGI